MFHKNTSAGKRPFTRRLERDLRRGSARRGGRHRKPARLQSAIRPQRRVHIIWNQTGGRAHGGCVRENASLRKGGGQRAGKSTRQIEKRGRSSPGGKTVGEAAAISHGNGDGRGSAGQSRGVRRGRAQGVNARDQPRRGKGVRRVAYRTDRGSVRLKHDRTDGVVLRGGAGAHGYAGGRGVFRTVRRSEPRNRGRRVGDGIKLGHRNIRRRCG